MSDRKKILLIDDAILNHITIRQALEDTYDVETTLSGREGLVALSEAGDDLPNLILLDSSMPDMSGMEVLEKIKNTPKYADIPIIFMMQASDADIEKQAYDLGISDIMVKPFVPTVMKERISKQITLSQYETDIDSQVSKSLEAMEKMYDFIVLSFAALIESRDGVVGGRLKNTVIYFKAFIEHLATLPQYKNYLTDNIVQKAIRTAPLHDVGKISVRDAVLQKPAALSDEEFEEMKMHTVSGGEFFDYLEMNIADKEFAHLAGQMARSHHERWDGRGYPDKLAGEKIPLVARVMSIVDTYDALTSRRPYKEPMSHERAMSIILENGGSQFDPALAEEYNKISPIIKSCLENKNSGENVGM